MIDVKSPPAALPLSGGGRMGFFLGALILLAFGLRVFSLGEQSLWLDEGMSFFFASLSSGEILRLTFSSEPNPPLYYLFLRYWIRLAGPSEFSLRFPSLVTGVLLLPVVFRLADRLFAAQFTRRAVVHLAALFCAISAFLVLYSQEVRMYSLLALLSTLTVWLLWRALEDGSVGRWLIFAVSLTLFLYTHIFALFLALPLGLFALYSLFIRLPALQAPQPRARKRLGMLLAFAAPLLLFSPWLVSTLGSGAARESWRGSYSIGQMLSLLLQAAVGAGAFWKSEFAQLAPPFALSGDILIICSLLLALSGIVAQIDTSGGKRLDAGALLTLCLLLTPLLVALVSTRQAIFAERYLIYLAPLFYLAMANGIGVLWERLGASQHRITLRLIVAFATLVLILALGFALRVALTDGEYRKEDFRSAAALIEKRASPEDPILLLADYIDAPFGYYFKESNGRIYPLNGDLNDTVALQTKIEGIVRGHDRVWLVLSHADEADPKGNVRRALSERFPTITEAYPRGIAVLGFRARSAIDSLPEGAVGVRRRFADPAGGALVELVGYSLPGYEPSVGVRPDDTLLHPPSNWLAVTLYWKADTKLASDFRSRVRLVNEKGVWAESLERDSSLMAKQPTSTWEPGKIYVEDVDVNINPATPPVTLGLDVGLLRSGSDAALTPAEGAAAIVGQVNIASSDK